MKASIEELNPVQRRVTVAFPADEVNAAFNAMFNEIRRKADLRGFRKGKAPLNIIRKFYGASVAGDVFQKLVRESLFGALEENNVQPVASPVIETTDLPQEGKEYAFSALVDILPKIAIDGYKGLTATAEVMVVNDELMAKELEHLQRQHAKNKPVDSADTKAAKGHVATISYTVDQDGKELERLKAEKIAVELGQEQLLPDLEKDLLGMRTGEQKSIKVKLPKDFGDQEIAGQKLTFNVVLHDLKELILPNLDDEFAKDLGIESLEQLRNNLKTRMEYESQNNRKQQIENQILDQMVKKFDFEVPPAIVDQVIDSMINQMKWDNKKEKEHALQDKEFRGRFLDSAKRQAKNTLLLLEISRKENLKVTDDDLDDHFGKMLGGGELNEQNQALIQQLKSRMANQVRDNLLFEKALRFLIDQANVTEIPRKI